MSGLTFASLLHLIEPVPLADTEIESMTMEQLLHVEHDLRAQNRVVDKHVASIHGRLSRLRVEQDHLESKWRKVGTAKNFEVRQRQARERAIARAEAGVEAKQQQITQLETEASRLRTHIRETWAAAATLRTESGKLQAMYTKPALSDAVVHSAARVGPVPLALANRTVSAAEKAHMLRIGLEDMEALRARLARGPLAPAALAALVVYVVALAVTAVVARAARTTWQWVSVPRMLLALDLAFAGGWAMAAVAVGVGAGDGGAGNGDGGGVFALGVQLVALTGVAVSVGLRCAMVAAIPSVAAFIELFVGVVVGQDFYQRVWTPVVLEEEAGAGAGAYVRYMLVYGVLAVRRARRLARLGGKAEVEDEFDDERSMRAWMEWVRTKSEALAQVVEDWLSGSEGDGRHGGDTENDGLANFKRGALV